VEAVIGRLDEPREAPPRCPTLCVCARNAIHPGSWSGSVSWNRDRVGVQLRHGLPESLRRVVPRFLPEPPRCPRVPPGPLGPNGPAVLGCARPRLTGLSLQRFLSLHFIACVAFHCRGGRGALQSCNAATKRSTRGRGAGSAPAGVRRSQLSSRSFLD
jgi:hypothetical protein